MPDGVLSGGLASSPALATPIEERWKASAISAAGMKRYGLPSAAQYCCTNENVHALKQNRPKRTSLASTIRQNMFN
jgi:hypothetical protein